MRGVGRRLFFVIPILVAVTLIVPTTVNAVAENIPGVPLAKSPIAASVESTENPHWVAAVRLRNMDNFTASKSATSATSPEFDLRIYSPYATDVTDAAQQANYILASSEKQLSPGVVRYTASQDATYYVDVTPTTEGTGTFILSYRIRHYTRVYLSATKKVVPYGGSAVLIAKLADIDNRAINKTIRFEYSSDGGTYWKYLKNVAATYGTASLAVKPGSKTYYRARFLGDSSYLRTVQEPSVVVTPKVYLTSPSVPTSMVCNKPYTVAGYLKPRHRSGVHSVRIQAQRYEGGAWVTKKIFITTNTNYSTYTKYIRTIALDLPGKWRVRACALADTFHATTYTGYKYVSVPTQKAASARGWVSSAKPVQFTDVTAYAKILDPYGKPIPHAKVVFTWHFENWTRTQTTYTGSTGVASATRYISGARPIFKVVINISASSGGNTVRTATYFTPVQSHMKPLIP